MIEEFALLLTPRKLFYLRKYCFLIFIEDNLLEMLQTTLVSLPRLMIEIIIQKLFIR